MGLMPGAQDGDAGVCANPGRMRFGIKIHNLFLALASKSYSGLYTLRGEGVKGLKVAGPQPLTTPTAGKRLC